MKLFFEVFAAPDQSRGIFEAATKEAALWAAYPDGPEQGAYAVLVEEGE
jgi:hypothetical protein